MLDNNDNILVFEDIESTEPLEQFTPNYTDYVRRINDRFSTLPQIVEQFNNVFTAIELIKNVRNPNMIVNITDEFLDGLRTNATLYTNIDETFERYRKLFGAAYNGSVSRYPEYRLITISSVEEHELKIEELANLPEEDLNKTLILYLTNDSSTLDDEFILSRRKELLIGGKSVNVINLTKVNVEEAMIKNIVEGISYIGDFPILRDRLLETNKIFENKKSRVENYATYKAQMGSLAEGYTGFIVSDRPDTITTGIVSDLVSELILQRGKCVGLPVKSNGQFMSNALLTFTKLSGDYMTKIPDVYTKAKMITEMSNLNILKGGDFMFLAVLPQKPVVYISMNHYCIFEEGYRNYRRYREDTKIEFSSVINPEEVITVNFDRINQAKNRELLCKFIEDSSTGIDLNNCIFFKRNGLIHIGVDCTIEIDCPMYVIPYDEAVGSSPVLKRNLRVRDLGSMLPLKCLLFNEDRVNELLGEVKKFILSKNHKNILEPVLGDIKSIKSRYEEAYKKVKDMVDFDIEDKPDKILRVYGWEGVRFILDKLVLYASDGDISLIKTCPYISINGKVRSVNNLGRQYFKSIGLLSLTDEESNDMIVACINALLNREATKESILATIRSNVPILDNYPNIEDEVENIKRNITSPNIDNYILQILAKNPVIVNNVRKHILDERNRFIAKLFTGFDTVKCLDKVSEELLDFGIDKFPIVLRIVTPLDFNVGSIGLTPYKFLSNFTKEYRYKGNHVVLNKDYNTMRMVAQFNEFNYPVLTSEYIDEGYKFTLHERGEGLGE